MISRVKLPKEDEFLEIADSDRGDVYRPKDPTHPKCTCSCSNLWKMALSFGAIWAINQI